jgi:hypothetical protein
MLFLFYEYLVVFKYWGFAPNPNYFFVLTQKSNQKKSRLGPLRTKNQRSTAKIF